MSDREKLAMRLCRGWQGNGLCVGQCHAARCVPAIQQYGDEADAILASDWLRDTLAAEREAAAHRAGVAYQHGTNGTDEWDYFVAASDAIDAAIRNLAPKENDDARG